jgi:hypothetical protein
MGQDKRPHSPPPWLLALGAALVGWVLAVLARGLLGWERFTRSEAARRRCESSGLLEQRGWYQLVRWD